MTVHPTQAEVTQAIDTLTCRYGGHYGVIVQLMRQVGPSARQSLIDHLQRNATLFGPEAMYVDRNGDDIVTPPELVRLLRL